MQYYYSYVIAEESVKKYLISSLPVITQAKLGGGGETSTKEIFEKYKSITGHDKTATNGTEPGMLWKMEEAVRYVVEGERRQIVMAQGHSKDLKICT